MNVFSSAQVATLDQKVVAHGNDAEIVYKEAKAKYPSRNLSLAKIPTGDTLILVM